REEISRSWNDAMALANAIKQVDTNNDIAAFDCAGEKIVNVYKNVASFGEGWFGWRVNAFCQPLDKEPDFPGDCNPNTFAYQWDTLCENGRCEINRDMDNSYINIMFCDLFFTLPELWQVIEDGKRAPKEKKYHMHTYWDNKGKLVLHELLHAATVGGHANDRLLIDDLRIKVRKHNFNGPDEFHVVDAYGPLNAKILARTVRNENWNTYVRRNDDNWAAYATVGVYPVLPLADDHAYVSGTDDIPNTLFLIDGGNYTINSEVYDRDTLSNQLDHLSSENEQTVVEDTTFRPASDYPEWYTRRIQEARGGELEDTPDENTPAPGPEPE
ncbi:uncharacterized protein EI97DRAFT_349320, partial [Westerdykella ornata]